MVRLLLLLSLLCLLCPLRAQAAWEIVGTPETVDAYATQSGSESITVDSEATAAIVLWCYWDGTSAGMSSLSIDSSNFTLSLTEGSTSSVYGYGAAVLANPSTGSQSLAWDWGSGGARDEGARLHVIYAKGVDTDNLVRDVDGNSEPSTSNPGPLTLTTLSTDLVVGLGCVYTGGGASGPQTVNAGGTGQTQLVASSDNQSVSSGSGYVDSPSDGTTDFGFTVSEGYQAGTIVAIAIKADAGAGSSGSPLRRRRSN